MYNNPFYMPGYNPTTAINMASSNLMRGGLPAARALAGTTRAASATSGSGLFSRLGASLAGIRRINWGGLINNTSKTLGIINQTIPIVRQVGPMIGNMRSMVRVASIFKDETDTRRPTNTTNTTNSTNTNSNRNYLNNTIYSNNTITANSNINQSTTIPDGTTNTISTNYKKEYSEAPTFFIDT